MSIEPEQLRYEWDPLDLQHAEPAQMCSKALLYSSLNMFSASLNSFDSIL